MTCLLLCSVALPLGAAAPIRVATFNTSLNDDQARLVERLGKGDERARKIAAVIQRVRPDLILLNEFDYDPALRAADLFQQDYLEVPQFGGEPIRYDFRFTAPVNTGLASGVDLNGDGKTGPASEHPNDAFGFGRHPGQYGMLVLSRFPIKEKKVRTFQNLLWHQLPGANRPRDPETDHPFQTDAVWQRLRLSSKSHWDVPIRTPLGTLHFLVAHPTPPTFDGPEDLNGRRNSDEIRLWAEYLAPEQKSWLVDDAGRVGGLPTDARFVIAGDLNADPVDGASRDHPVAQLLAHARVLDYPPPCSEGAASAASDFGTANAAHQGDPAVDTGDFGPRVGRLRIDYVLPSRHFQVHQSGVFWPRPDETGAAWLDASDHHAVWVDLLPAD